MSKPFDERVWTSDYSRVLRLYEVPPEGGEEGPMLELMADNGDEYVVQRLTPDQAHALRLTLQRWERRVARRAGGDQGRATTED